MAGIGQEAVTPIRPDLLTSQIQPLQLGVQQNAVAQLADAFRQGVITSDDIIARYGDLAKTQQKAQIQGLDELISPEAIAQRKQATELMSAKQKSELANLPAAEAAQKATLEQTRIQAEQGDRAAMRKYAIEHGFGAYLSAVKPGESYSDQHAENDARVYQDAVKYAQAVTSANEIQKDINPVVLPKEFTKDNVTSVETDPTNPTLVSKGGAGVYTQDQGHLAATLGRMTPQEWVDAGRPTAGEYVFGAKPGEVTNQVTARPGQQPQQKPVLQPVNELVIPGKTEETTTETTKPDGTKTVVTKRVKVDSAQHPESIADLKPGQKVEIKPSSAKAPTEAQQRAELALSRFASANDVFAKLKEQGYDPTSVVSWVNSYLPEIIKSGDRKTYEAAVDAWSQGLLRLESGAAISRQEKSWYDRAFFPQVNDPAKVVENKAKMRSDVERMVGEIAQAGNVVSPESEAQVKRIYAQADANAKASGAVTPKESGRPTYQLQSTPGQEIVDLGNGRYKVRSIPAKLQ